MELSSLTFMVALETSPDCRRDNWEGSSNFDLTRGEEGEGEGDIGTPPTLCIEAESVD